MEIATAFKPVVTDEADTFPTTDAEFEPETVSVAAVDPCPMLEVIVTPFDATKPPPTAAEVPPPTNAAVMAAFVISATLTLVSIVTVKLLL
jgi:hypothetical protein